MRRGDEYAGQFALEDRFRLELVLRVSIAMQEQDRGGLDPFLVQRLRESLDLQLVERLQDLAAGVEPLFDLVAMLPRDQGPVLLEKEIVRVRPIDTADLVDVAEAFGDEERGLGARALQKRIDRHCR